MKCPNCGGTGKVVHPMMTMNGDEYTGEWEQHECEMCGGTGEVEMTEQEYIQTCNTEQLAEFLANVEMYGNTKYVSWLKWLKQPHTNFVRSRNW